MCCSRYRPTVLIYRITFLKTIAGREVLGGGTLSSFVDGSWLCCCFWDGFRRFLPADLQFVPTMRRARGTEIFRERANCVLCAQKRAESCLTNGMERQLSSCSTDVS